MMKKIFAANWKLFKTPQETRDFFTSFKNLLSSSPSSGEIVFFPSAICLEAASISLKDSKISWGAQNCYIKAEGAFTGENSAQTVKSLGGQYILIGHSERRSLFLEKDEDTAEKVSFVQSLGLIPMLCIGETLQERESNKTVEVVARQLRQGLSRVQSGKPLVVAYEPVWAIGTGKVATAEQVAETHKSVFEILKSLGLEETPILYGGSVKADNAAGLINHPHVNGFLVGGASLDPESFIKITSV